MSGGRLHFYHRALNIITFLHVVAGCLQAILWVLIEVVGLLDGEDAGADLLLLLQEILLVHVYHGLIVTLPHRSLLTPLASHQAVRIIGAVLVVVLGNVFVVGAGVGVGPGVA